MFTYIIVVVSIIVDCVLIFNNYVKHLDLVFVLVGSIGWRLGLLFIWYERNKYKGLYIYAFNNYMSHLHKDLDSLVKLDELLDDEKQKKKNKEPKN